ncbi:helix-turn-helix protein [Rhizobium laguerreae]|uniref:Helix-turn-helix protein n=2 Tax=Rhizobium/Agrobacterium group TaxID=227290 RepID=A0AAX2QB26_9HYPH|nr:helix-turn-helix protein [Rhizobium laguerreae]
MSSRHRKSSIALPARPAGTKEEAFAMLQVGEEIKVLSASAPTSEYGIAVARVSFRKGTFTSGVATHHMIGIGCSLPTSVEHMIDGKRLRHHITPGSLCLCPVQACHSTAFGGSMSGIVLRISPECLALATSDLLGHNAGLIEQLNGRDGFIAHVAHVLKAEAAAGHPNGTLFWNAATDALLAHLVRQHLDQSPPPNCEQLDLNSINHLDSFIRANLDETLSLDSLAEIVSCGRFQFARLFQSTMGISPYKYVIRRRLETARAMIQARKVSLAEISAATGFSDQSHMTKWIKRVYGATPTQLAG